MSGGPRTPLYTPQMLALAVELADFPYDAEAPFSGSAKSRTCGSAVTLSFERPEARPGLQVTACAVGQAAAAIFARHYAEKGPDSLVQSLAQVEHWLGQEGELPDWPDLDLITPARGYPARHEAITLPWKAAIDALFKDGHGR